MLGRPTIAMPRTAPASAARAARIDSTSCCRVRSRVSCDVGAGDRFVEDALRAGDRLALGAELDHLLAVAARELFVERLLDTGQVARTVGSERADQAERRVAGGVHSFGRVLEDHRVVDARSPRPRGPLRRAVVLVDRFHDAHPGVGRLRREQALAHRGAVRRRAVRRAGWRTAARRQGSSTPSACSSTIDHSDPLARHGDRELDPVAVDDRSPRRHQLDLTEALVLAVCDQLRAVADLHADQLPHRGDGQDRHDRSHDHEPLTHGPGVAVRRRGSGVGPSVGRAGAGRARAGRTSGARTGCRARRAPRRSRPARRRGRLRRRPA